MGKYRFELPFQSSTLVELLRKQSQHQPQKIAYSFLLDGEQEKADVSYGELDCQARAIAVLLQSYGVKRGERALLLYPPGLEFIAAFFGCLYAGVVAVPVYPPRLNKSLSRLESVIVDAQTAIALTTKTVIERQFPLSENLKNLQLIATDNIIVQDFAPAWQEPTVNSDTLAFLQYTSGSTGTPKGVMVSHGNLLHNQQLIAQGMQHTDKTLFVGWLPLFHDMGLVGNLLQPLYLGIPCILMSPVAFLEKPYRWLKAISQYQATTSGGPNFAYDLCVQKITPEQRETLDISSWEVAFNGSETVRAQTLERFATTFADCGFRREAFYPCYGMAETTLIVSGGLKTAPPHFLSVQKTALRENRIIPANVEEMNVQTLVSCGQPLQDLEIVIADPETKTHCAANQVGEIWVKGSSVTLGYWNRNEQTQQTFQAYLKDSREGSFLRTGDLGFLWNGELYITGRLKDLIVIRGRNHYPQDIEKTVEQSHPALQLGSSAAFSVEVQDTEKLVVAIEVKRTYLRHLSVDEVINSIRQAVVEEHELQVYGVLLLKTGTIPKTSSGKIQRYACRAGFLHDSLDIVGSSIFTESSFNPREEKLTREALLEFNIQERHLQLANYLQTQVAQVLKIDQSQFDIQQPLSSLGIDSLMAIELKNCIETNLGVVVPITSFLEGASIDRLVKEILAKLTSTPEINPVSTTAENSLAYGQRSLYFLHQLNPESPAYNIAGVARIQGELDVTALQVAFQTLLERHASLRTSFHNQLGEIYQQIHENTTVYFDIKNVADVDEASLNHRLSQEAYRPFNLEESSLLRVSLFRRSPQEHTLLLVVHHIVADFWSIAVLIQELGILYEAQKAGIPANLKPLKLQYSDYVHWQKAMLASQVGKDLLSYWQKQLAGELPVLNLPTDKPRPTIKSDRGASIPFRFSPDLTQKLKTLSQTNGTTLYMTLLAAFQVLLYRYTSQEDILVGSPTTGRSRADMDSIVGYFVNPVVLRANLAGNPTFAEFLQQVRITVLDAFQHQDYPFAELVEQLVAVRDPSRSPLFQTMFVWQKSHLVNQQELAAFALGETGAKITIGDLQLESLAIEQSIAQFDLTLNMAEVEGSLCGSWQYSTDLFVADTINRMAGNFQTLVEGIIADQQQLISALPILSKKEQHQLLVEWNGTQVDYASNLCLHQKFEDFAARTPDAIAIVYEQERLTYQQLNQRANQLAHYLQTLGVKPEVLVGICMERSVEMVVGLLAILKAGGAYVPLEPTYPQERIALMLAETSVSVVLTQSWLQDTLPPHPTTVICVDKDWDAISTHPQSNLVSGVTNNHLAYVIYTSGSTGKPKGVMNTHQGLCNRLLWMQSTYQLTTTDRVLQKTPFSFDVSVWEFFWPLITGACLVVAKPKGHQDSAYLVKLIAQEKITTIHFVPSMLQFFIAEPALELCQSLKRVFCSGEALPFELQQRFFARLNVELHNLYGPTEAAIDVTFWQCQRQSNLTIVPIGRPIQNTQIYILDSQAQPVPIGVPGELHIGGDGLARGYLNSPELTAQKFIPNPFDNSKLYKTGDLARYLRDGNIEYLGRIDHQVKIRGFRIELGEIEAVLSQHPAVRETVVLARTDSPGNQQLVAYIVTVSEPTPTISELRRFLQEKLPDYMLPGAFVFLNALPLTVNGKINRQVLPPPAKLRCLTTSRYASTQLEVADVTPQTEVEAKIATVWQKVLNLADIGIYDNFFELGGNSLLIFQVNSQLRQIFAIDLSIPELFKYPTIQSLGAYLQQFNSQEDNYSQLQIQPLSQESNYFLLSFAQQRLWFLDQLQPGNTVYNISQAIHLKGSLNITALEQSFREIINRHAALRTTFTTVDGRPVQIISSVADFTMPMVDLTDLAANQQQLQIQKLANQEAQHSFDLAKGPLLRVNLLKLSQAEHILLFVIHHIVADAKSCAIIIREIAILYEAFSRGEPSPLPELSIQYTDFAHWQRQWLEGKVLETQLTYWKQQLAGLPPVLTLPTDKSILKSPGLAGANISFMLTPNLSQMLKKFSLEAGVTLFMTLLAAFQTLLYRYSHQEDFAVGTAIDNRKSSETDPLIGFFVNTLVLRANLAGNPSFVELLNRVREVALAAYAHQDLPFEKLVEELQPERHLSHNPLFQVMFVLWNAPMPDLHLGDLSLIPLDVDSTTSRVDLTLAVADTPEGLQASFEYKTDLFDAATINRMVEHFQTLLESIVAHPNQKLTDLTILTEVEQHQLLVEWNHTQVNYPQDQCIHQLFEAQVELTPDAIAVVFEQEQLTYRQLNTKANQLAQYLKTLGVKPDVLVGICLERSLEMVIAILAILKAGGAYVPLDPTYPQERLAFILQDTQIAVLLTQQQLMTVLPEYPTEIVCLDRDWEVIAKHSQDNPDSNCTVDNLAYVIYTSGSTGQPKGVLIEHRNVTRLFDAVQSWFNFNSQDVWTLFHSIAFDFSVWELWGALLYGGRLVIVPHWLTRSPEAFYNLLSEQQVTVLNQTPSAFRQLIALEESLETTQQLALRLVIFGGEALEIHSLKPWFERHGDQFPQLVNMYGITETTVHVTYRPLSMDDLNQGLGSVIGRRIPDLQVYLLDQHQQPVPVGVPGEMYIGGAGLARGYLHRPELTQEKFIPHPFSNQPNARLYRSGDQARYLPNGDIEYLGRIDQQVKIRGFRIELGEIEAVLNSHPYIQQAVVIATEDIKSNKRLVAYVIPRDQSLTINELRAFLKQKLPEYMVPSAFVTLESLPLTPNGKIDRKALPTPDGAINRESEYIAPRTPTEEIIANIWQELLFKEKVSIYDNFFEIGGDSILSIQVVSHAKNSGVQITPKQIFQHQTIAELARVANTTVSVECKQGIVTGVAPLTAIQHWFFGQNRQEAHHFNQSVLLLLPNHVQSELIEIAIKKLLEHHDALRLRFTSAATAYKQINLGLDDRVPFTVVDLSSIPKSEQPQALEKIATEYQASLNLSSGLIVQVVMFNLGDEDARLLIIIHHLAVDGVSWRILLSDLETIYQQLIDQKPCQLAAKTTAFIDWAEKINNYAQSEIIKQELDYWLNQPWSKITPIPLDYTDSQTKNTVGSAATVSVKLNVEETQTLLLSVNEAHHTQINDILLSALVQVLAEWTGNSTVLINLEGHGREELLSDVDLSRTVGWFTSLFPVLLQVPKINQPAVVIKSIKEQLRAIPHRGIGYGILRYLCEDPNVNQQIQSIPTSEIVFNYLGQFDQVQSQTGWRLAPESTGTNYSAKQIRDQLLNISCLVLKGELQINWTYSHHVHTNATVEKLAQKYIQSIRSIIEHFHSEDTKGYTPSDFPDAQLNQLELDELLAPVKTKNIESIYPLSPMQQGMLFHSLYAPESGMYFEQITLNFQGNVNVVAFESAWQKVVDRYSVFRSFFVWKNRPNPLQVVLKQVDLPWYNLDWRELSLTEQQQQLSELLQTQRKQGFQFSQAPLMNCTLIQLSDDTYEFIWSHHHILIDGWCLPIIFKDVLNFYEAELTGETCYLPTPRPYHDYIAWLNSQDKKAASEFWRQTLQGFSAPTPLTVNKIQYQNQQPDSNYCELELRLSAEVSRKLQSVAQRQHVTLSTIVQAAWGLLLSRYSGDTDIVFGVTVSGRSSSLSGVENMVGLFINTLPLRLLISPEEKLIPWLQQIQQSMLELQHYSYIPLVDVQVLSELPGKTSLFESIVVFENYPVDISLGSEDSSLQLSQIKGFEHTNYPLTVVAIPGDELLVKISYDTVRFEKDTIGRMLGHLQTIFSAIVENPQQAIGEIPLLSAAERHQLLVEWNTTESEYPTDKCIHQLFEEQVEKTPQAVALVFENQQLTYRELNHRANQLAHHLQTLGVKPEVLVGIFLERSLEMVIAILAILKAGGAYVPLDPTYPQERLAFILQDTQISVLLTQQQLMTVLPEYPTEILCLDRDWEVIAQHSADNLDSRCTVENLAYVIYTSGSTGKPKGTLITHQGLVNYLSWCTQAYTVEQGVGTLVHSPLGFDLTVTSLFSPLLVGRQVELLPENQGIEALSCALRRSRNLSLVKITPSHLELLKEQLSPEEVAGCTRALIIGGENLLAEKLGFWQDFAPDTMLINEYGPTETVVGCCVYQVPNNQRDSGSIPIGKPIANTKLYVLDKNCQLVPIGVIGELYIGGLGLARGYLNQPKLTAQKFIPNPFSNKVGERLYKTGDLARYRPDGTLEFLGRIDNQVKIRGFRIELGEIETVLAQHPAVQETVVLARETQTGDRQLVAYVVPKKQQTPTTSQLRNFLQEHLPEFMLPAFFIILEALPLTSNGKVDHRSLPIAELISPELEKTFVEPHTNLEKQLAAIWVQVLSLEKVGINDNFFELGGDSILSLQVISKAHQIGLHLTPKQLFQYPTIAKLATVAQITEKIPGEQGLVTGLSPLTPIQHWFFAQKQPEPHHWNQAVLLEVKQSIDPGILKQAIQYLLRHHDVLRWRFIQKEFGSQAIITNPDDVVPFTQLNLSTLSKEEQAAAIEATAVELQASLNFSAGPLLRLALFDLGSDRPGYLFWTIHHLVVDGVSWRILVEDLQIAYQQLSQGKAIQLSPKTTSFQQWSYRLQEYAQSSVLLSELDYWLAIALQPVKPIPVDYPDQKENTEATTRTLSVSLSVEETQVLLQQVPTVYHTQINDVLLTALTQTFTRWTGETSLLVDLEGHGREELFENVDLSRTVGWFTSIFPVHLSVNASEPGEALKAIKEQLRAIPNRGIGYGMLRYLSQNQEIIDKLSLLPKAELIFNYLGQIDQILSVSSLFNLAQESTAAHSLRNQRTHLLEINGAISQGRLQMNWTYSEQLHQQTTVERLAQGFIEALRSLLTHCQAPDAGSFTPSDFAEFEQSQWNQADLDAITAIIGDL